MLYLSGSIRPEIHHPQIGWMMTPKIGNRLPAHGWWAADTGCFADPTGFSWPEYERWLRKKVAIGGDRLIFATTPDIPFNSDETLARFDQYIDQMKAIGTRNAIVTQDGMHPEDLRWNDIDAVFVGGTTAWKTGQESAAICGEARRRGLWVHMGRVNSLQRLRVAQTMGCNSADGTFVAFGPDRNKPQLLDWVRRTQLQPAFVLTV